jgi:hypothetical protein
MMVSRQNKSQPASSNIQRPSYFLHPISIDSYHGFINPINTSVLRRSAGSLVHYR